jgi:hypothetical protein
LDGYAERANAFAEAGAMIVAATNDAREDTLPVAEGKPFPVCYGVTRELGDRIGAWWETRRGHIQPSEFLLNRSGRVLSSTYSSSPVGRMDPEEALTLLRILNARRK